MQMRRTSHHSALSIARLAAAGGVLIAMLLITLGARQAIATPKFGQETSRACEFCHSNPPALNERGKNFARTRPAWW